MEKQEPTDSKDIFIGKISGILYHCTVITRCLNRPCIDAFLNTVYFEIGIRYINRPSQSAKYIDNRRVTYIEILLRLLRAEWLPC